MSRKVGLVLGAGGAVGRAWHAGTLAAIADVTGFDARDAAVIVGTSAGSVDGALLRAGLSPRDLLSRVTDQPLTPEGSELLEGVPMWNPPEEPEGSQRWRPASPARLLAAARRPWAATPGSIFAAFMPEGRRSTVAMQRDIDRLLPGSWPAGGLWICAVRLDDGQRVVFRGDANAAGTVGEAVAASCAIPGYFAPVLIGDTRYVDGGVHSPSNADLLAGAEVDIVLVSSPMTADPRALRLSPDGAFRGACRVLLRREAAAVRRRGTPVLLIEPDLGDLASIGSAADAMDYSRRANVAMRTYDSVRARLETGPLATEIDALRV